MFIHFIDFEKVFDLVHRESLWIIIRKYGIPNKLIQIVKEQYEDF